MITFGIKIKLRVPRTIKRSHLNIGNKLEENNLKAQFKGNGESITEDIDKSKIMKMRKKNQLV